MDNREHWQIINSGGRVLTNTPEQLWNAAMDYFKWTDEHPITAKRALTTGKEAGKQVQQEYKRPYSIKAMCLHCNISERYIKDIQESHTKDSEWYMVMEKILMVIYTQNLEGAMVDLYNPMMVSKVLNLGSGVDDTDRTVRVEIVSSQSGQLANSENEVLKKLDSEKLEILKTKVENT